MTLITRLVVTYLVPIVLFYAYVNIKKLNPIEREGLAVIPTGIFLLLLFASTILSAIGVVILKVSGEIGWLEKLIEMPGKIMYFSVTQGALWAYILYKEAVNRLIYIKAHKEKDDDKLATIHDCKACTYVNRVEVYNPINANDCKGITNPKRFNSKK